ncbi:hypothetical protein BH09BAC4_BH09BAC4_50220 [soil metagenome]
MIRFNEAGYITPSGTHTLTIEEFELTFANLDNASRRRSLFDSYQIYLSELRKIVTEPFFQLIGGSYASRKVWPQDIDIVTFVPYSFEQNDNLKHQLRLLFERYEFSQSRSGLHTFFSLIADDQNPVQAKFEAHYQYWISTFGSTPGKNTDPKGIIKIHFS